MINRLKISFNIFEAKAKVIFFVFLFFYILGLFTYSLSSYRTDDPIPEVKTISAKMRKEYRDFSALVRAGFFINNFPKLDLIKNITIVDAIIWFEYNKNELMLKTIEQFSIEDAKMLEKSSPKIRRYGDRMLVKYNVKFEVKTNVSFHKFPLEDHRLSIILKNDTVSAEELYFDDNVNALSFKIDDDIFISDWKIHSLQKISGYEPLFFDENQNRRVVNVPKAVFTINFMKAGFNKILIVLVPIFAAVFLSFFTFLMSYNSYQGKYSLSITAITALLGYRFVIHQMSPSVGYFTLTDKLFVFFLALCFFIFAFQVVLVRQYMFLFDRKNITMAERAIADIAVMTPKKTEQIGSIAFFSLGIIFALVVTLFVFW